LAVGILVDDLRLLPELAVGLRHLAGDRREQIGHRLHGLDDAEGLLGREPPADLGQLDEHHVTELLLGEGRDAHAHAAALRLGPLVLPRVLEIRRYVRHRQPFLTFEGWKGVFTTCAGLTWLRLSTTRSVP